MPRPVAHPTKGSYSARIASASRVVPTAWTTAAILNAVVVCRKSVNVGMLFAQVRRVVKEYTL